MTADRDPRTPRTGSFRSPLPQRVSYNQFSSTLSEKTRHLDVVATEVIDLTVQPGVTEELERQNRFVTDNLRRIFVQIYRIVGNAADAQDLTQETFIKALQRQEQLKDE